MAGSVRTKLDSMASKLSANIVATKKRSAINPKCRFDLPIGQSSARGLRAEIYPGESFHSPEDYSSLFIYLFIFFERQFYINLYQRCAKRKIGVIKENDLISVVSLKGIFDISYFS